MCCDGCGLIATQVHDEVPWFCFAVAKESPKECEIWQRLIPCSVHGV